MLALTGWLCGPTPLMVNVCVPGLVSIALPVAVVAVQFCTPSPHPGTFEHDQFVSTTWPRL
ncbi:MAG: hypothetical protein JO304_19735 [Solirubrobacterales bacterium]|nr:hypothetical protein [Solirubrobacterales bacterium]